MPAFDKPLVYACSGCSNVAQLTNDIAVVLDREGIAEMSCITGIGGRVKSLVKVAQSGRPVLALDGCPLNCVRHTLATIDVVPTWHIEVTSLAIKARQQDCSLNAAYELLQHIQSELLARPPAPLSPASLH